MVLDAPEPPLDADVVALGVSALAATGVRGIRWASGGGWNAADTAGPNSFSCPRRPTPARVSRQAPRPDSSCRPVAHRKSEQRAHRRRTIHGTKTARPAGIRVDTG